MYIVVLVPRTLSVSVFIFIRAPAFPSAVMICVSFQPLERMMFRTARIAASFSFMRRCLFLLVVVSIFARMFFALSMAMLVVSSSKFRYFVMSDIILNSVSCLPLNAPLIMRFSCWLTPGRLMILFRSGIASPSIGEWSWPVYSFSGFSSFSVSLNYFRLCGAVVAFEVARIEVCGSVEGSFWFVEFRADRYFMIHGWHLPLFGYGSG